MATIGTLIGNAADIAKIDVNSIGLAALEMPMLITIGNRANREYYSATNINGEPSASRIGTAGGDLIATTTLSEALTTSTTDFDVASATNFPTSGAIAVYRDEMPDYIEYTGKTGNNLTGVTNISFSHLEDEPVSALYALPSNFESFRSTPESPDGVTVNGSPFVFTADVPTGDTFGVYDNGTTKYLVFNRDVSGFYVINYNKGATNLTSENDVVDLAIADDEFIVYRILEHIYITLNVELDKVQRARQLADSILLKSLKRKNIGKRLKHGRQFNAYY